MTGYRRIYDGKTEYTGGMADFRRIHELVWVKLTNRNARRDRPIKMLGEAVENRIDDKIDQWGYEVRSD